LIYPGVFPFRTVFRDAVSSRARACGKDGGERAVIQDRIFSELYDGKIADLYENFSRANAPRNAL
jgi:hypothetical protein